LLLLLLLLLVMVVVVVVVLLLLLLLLSQSESDHRTTCAENWVLMLWVMGQVPDLLHGARRLSGRSRRHLRFRDDGRGW
jgi:hypothetical protein